LNPKPYAAWPILGRGIMRTKYFPFFCLLIVAVLILSSCNMPGNEAPTEELLPTEPPTSTATVEPTATSTQAPSVTQTETLAPEPSATATPEVITAEVVRESNCRIGPAGDYDLVATYQAGQALEIVANDLGAGYIFVKDPEKPDDPCYLLTQNIKASGDTSVLPKFTPPPSPTAAPYFNVSFRKFDTCSGKDYAIFTVENAGSIPFRSFYIKVTDQKADKSVEHVVNAFDNWTGCIIAKDISPLERGATGYVHSPPFNWNVAKDRIRAVIMLCTDKDLKGTCVTQIIDVK
jgi:hypothetical protein